MLHSKKHRVYIPRCKRKYSWSLGTFGAQCANQCQCSTNGTALCLHTTGQCFCSPNWYGNTCELNCPFGYVDDVCHTSPVDPDVCICSSDQMICDHIKGMHYSSFKVLFRSGIHIDFDASLCKSWKE